MTDKTRIDMEVPADEFAELSDFIDEWKSSRRDSKRYYGLKIFEMAKKWALQQQREMEMAASEFRTIQEEIQEVLADV